MHISTQALSHTHTHILFPYIFILHILENIYTLDRIIATKRYPCPNPQKIVHVLNCDYVP